MPHPWKPQPPTSAGTTHKTVAAIVLLAATAAFGWTVVWPLVTILR